jgi:excisionase family DNA binding protein
MQNKTECPPEAFGESLLTYKEFAERLSVSVRTLHRLIASGALPRAVKLSGASRLYLSDCVEYLQRLKKARELGSQRV